MNDIELTIWGYKTFQQCVPEKYRHDIAYLVGTYYRVRPIDSAIKKIISLSNKYIEENPKEIDVEKQLKYIKSNFSAN